MHILHLDEPKNQDVVGNGDAVSGWWASPSPDVRPNISINGREVTFSPVNRPDVAKVTPGMFSQGFLFFLDPPDNRDGLCEMAVRLDDEVTIYSFHVAPGALEAAKRDKDAAEHNLKLLEYRLACGVCKFPAVSSEIIGQRWTCRQCGAEYDCTNSLNMIPRSYANFDAIQFGGATCRHGYDGQVEQLLAEVAAMGGVVLDCGAGLRQRIRPGVVTTEILPYPTTDVVAVGEHLPFIDGSFDAVISLHVLEHVKNPFVLAAELMRILRPGGRFIVVTPYICPVHGFPFHFFNPTPDGLRTLFGPYSENCEITVPLSGNPIYALSALLKELIPNLSAEKSSAFSSMTVGQLSNLGIEDLTNLGMHEGLSEYAMRTLSGNYMIEGQRNMNSNV